MSGQFIKESLVVKLCDIYQNCISTAVNHFDDGIEYYEKTRKIISRIENLYEPLYGGSDWRYDIIVQAMIGNVKAVLSNDNENLRAA